MNAIASLVFVGLLLLIAYFGTGVANLDYLFGVVLPYLGFGIFVLGIIYRVIKWAKAPVPFRIPSTCGQQKSFPWIKHDKLENPFTAGQVLVRMFLEIVLFRSLFRNTKAEVTDSGYVAYGPEKVLWLAGIAFHYTMLVIILRHLRFFLEPIPAFVSYIQYMDGFFQIAIPTLYLSSLIFLTALFGLFLRRVLIPQVKYISLLSDYFPLFLLMGIGITGIWMRYFSKVDIEAVKELTIGLASFNPGLPAHEIGTLFYLHLFLVTSLFIYFPFSKLMHLGGVFLSPTRNMANNNRAKRHINPWNYPVKTHTYDEYEDDFREKMKMAGVPVEKE